MRGIFIGVLIGIVLSVGAYYGKRMVQNYISSQQIVSPIGKILEKPLEKYSILRLSGRTYPGSQIVFDEATATTSAYTVFSFHYTSDGKKVTGVAHVPKGEGSFPVIVQFRGFIDPDTYTPGDGTRHSAQVFAANGLLSLAPDFLGFGGSDEPGANVFEERFETYTAALNLLASVRSLPMADATRVGIWGHSNGGQIALTVLEILGRSIPTTLWAPVSKPFPYSILYYTDEFDDHGKALRKVLAEFEREYDAEKYSLTNYMNRIVAPVQIQQGGADDAVPVVWSDALADVLEDADYFIYPGADHDMNGSWDTVMTRDIEFFRRELR